MSVRKELAEVAERLDRAIREGNEQQVAFDSGVVAGIAMRVLKENEALKAFVAAVNLARGEWKGADGRVFVYYDEMFIEDARARLEGTRT